jgi:large subunit ribosomal protein L54
MICRNCLRAASKARITPFSSQPRRFISSSSHLANATPNAVTSSPAASQPFSAPLTPAPSPTLKAQAADASKKKVAPLVKSSVVAGTPLKGLNFEKNKSDPVALADEEYPEWLWTILTRQEKAADGAGMGDLFCTLLPFFFHRLFPFPLAISAYLRESYYKIEA